jgi:hypothetical protein
MPYSGMSRLVALVRTDVSEERIACIMTTRIGQLVTANFVPTSPILVTLMMEAVLSS